MDPIVPFGVKSRMRVVGLASVLVVAAACASAPIKPSVQQQLAAADALVLQGCYDCLNDARDLYDHAATGKARPLVIARLFETTLLLGLRARELAIDAASTFDRARALAAELPPTYDAATYLAIAAAIAPDASGTPHADARTFRLAHNVSNLSLATWLSSLDTGAAQPAFRQYLAVALGCTTAAVDLRQVGDALVQTPSAGAPPRPPFPDGAPPLVRSRYGACGRIDSTMLSEVIGAVPRFVEAGLGLARADALKTNSSAATSHARAVLTPLVARFPTSPAVQLEAGHLDQRIGDCRAALEHYDEVLAAQPRHEDALLQRTVCLSYTKQYEDAIATATRMIEWNTDNFPEAYYWRAWNHYQRHELPTARTDSDKAKSVLYRDRVMLLAGMIEHDQDDLDIAETDLNLALRANGQLCPARWYLGLVQLKRQSWGNTAGEFAVAMSCYEADVRQDRQDLAKMQAADVDPHFKAAQIANFEMAIIDDASQQSASAYNAAVNYLRAGDKDKATSFADLAARDPARAAVVAELRKLIIRLPRPQPEVTS